MAEGPRPSRALALGGSQGFGGGGFLTPLQQFQPGGAGICEEGRPEVFLHYRQRGGQRRAPLPDFYIGAHAATESLALLTRDAARYRTYFPTVQLIAPEQNG